MTSTAPLAAAQNPVDPQLRVWRTTTAVRVFALALATGTVISDGTLGQVVPMLVVLAILAAVAAALEWLTRAMTTPWHAIAEAILVAILLTSSDVPSGLTAVLAVPAIVTGIRHGLVASLNVSLLAGLAMAISAAVTPQDDAFQRAFAALPWLVVGLGVGLLTSWQSRTTRGLTARQAPYAAAHHLMARLHRLAQSGAVGLDSATLAAELDAALRESTGAARSAVFVVDRRGRLRLIAQHGDGADLEREARIPDTERTPGAAVVALRGANHVLGYCVLAGVGHWTSDRAASANDVADDFALRLDTAVLFDEVRHLATSEERNRIAREMHDGVAQEIVALGYAVDEIESVSAEPQTRALAAGLRDEISRVVTELRYSIFDLRHQVAEAELAGALTDYVQEVSRDTELRVHLLLDDTGPELPHRSQAEVMKIAQEAIGNVRRHARATNLWVTYSSDAHEVRLEIADDGIGHASPKDRHWGLQTMRERAQGIGAALEIKPRPEGGTLVCLTSRPVLAIEGSAHHEHQSSPH